MPWVRLHAAKDYVDIPLIAAAFPRVRTTVNLVPVLLDQVDDVARGAGDTHLVLCQRDPAELRPDERDALLEPMFRLPVETMIRPLPRYAELRARALRDTVGSEFDTGVLGSGEVLDLVVLFHLAWSGPLLRRDPVVTELLRKGHDFTVGDRDALLARQAERAAELVPTMRALQDEGRIEISTTPYCHPILPLLCDSDAAATARPGCPPPRPRFQHPEDARRQVERALASMEARFGRRPLGLWPSEGSVSPAVIEAIRGLGVEWLATDVQILRKDRGGREPLAHLRPWRVAGGPAVLFRDTDLSDRIGFRYAHRPPREAAMDFVARVRALGAAWTGPGEPTVTVVLDGENAWEHYPDQGLPFLRTLYLALSEARDIETVTASEAVARCSEPGRMEGIGTGSWIRGDFDTWAGHPEKNRAWTLLADARDAVRRWEPTEEDPARRELVRRRLDAAEGSDWFWWLGDDHPTPYLSWFDACFRQHLRSVWEGMGLQPPPSLLLPIARRDGWTDRRWRPPTGPIQPPLDPGGWPITEWTGAGLWRAVTEGGAMRSGEAGPFHQVRIGADGEHLHLCVDPGATSLRDLSVTSRLTMEIAGITIQTDGLAEGVDQCLGRSWMVRLPRARLPPRWAEGPLTVRLQTEEREERLDVPAWALQEVAAVPPFDWSA
jgi:alpha-amylase/alpha-mannosidase (GH57 family)